MSMMDLEYKLNKLAKGSILDGVSPYAIEVHPWGDTTSTTIIFNKDQERPFKLEDIVAVLIRQYVNDTPKYQVPSDFKGVVALHRAAISYGAALRIETTEQLNKVIEPVLNAAKVDLINQIGDLFGYKLSAQMPGYDQTRFFRELDDRNALEFRIVVTKE